MYNSYPLDNAPDYEIDDTYARAEAEAEAAAATDPTPATDPQGTPYAGIEKQGVPPRAGLDFSVGGLVSRVIHGKFFSIDFFRRHWGAVLGVVIMLMIYITSRYSCQTQMETIQRLQTELEVAKTERIREKSAYMSRIRESVMQHKIDSLGLNLTVQEQPPYKIQK